MFSSRHWNVERHIDLRHNGKGDIIRFIEYLDLANTGRIPPPSYPEDYEGYLTEQKDLSLKGLINARLENEVNKRIKELRAKKISDFEMNFPYIKCISCRRCLVMDLQVADKVSSGAPLKHVCDPIWLADAPDVAANRDLVYEHLEVANPRRLFAMIKELFPKIRLRVATNGGIKDNTITNYLKEGDPQARRFLAFQIAMYNFNKDNKRYEDSTILSQINSDPKKIGHLSCVRRALVNENGSTNISDKELFEFLSITGSTMACYKETKGDTTYTYLAMLEADYDSAPLYFPGMSIGEVAEIEKITSALGSIS